MKVFIRIIFVDVCKSSFEIIIGQKWYFKFMLTKVLSHKRMTLREHHIEHCKIVLLLEQIETLNVQYKIN